jgi:hypothetical protein
MTNKTGIWIDHRKAVIVTILADGEHVDTLLSNVEKHPERAGDSPLKGPYEVQQVPADDKRQRALTGHLNGYYDAVISKIAGTDMLLIFGPGEAKGELRSRLEKKGLAGLIAAVETEDRMTDRQIAAKTHKYFEASAHHKS